MAIRILTANDGCGENAAVAKGMALYVGIVARHSYRCKPCVVEGILLDTAHAGRNVYRLHLRLVSESPFADAHHLIRHTTMLHHTWNLYVTAVVAFQFARQFNGVTTQNLVVQFVLCEDKPHIACSGIRIVVLDLAHGDAELLGTLLNVELLHSHLTVAAH